MVSLALRSSCSEFGRPRSVKTLPLLFSCVATISPLSFYLVQSFGRFQALANDLDIALGCRDATLRFFPIRVPDIDLGREPNRINRPVAVAAMILDQFQHAGAPKAS